MRKKKDETDQKGAISINFVILMFIALIFIMGAMSFMSKTMAINEIQGIMDKSGIIALRSSVDETKFRREELFVQKSQARNEFKRLIGENLKTGPNSFITDYEIKEINIYGPNDLGIKGLGIPGGNNDQYFLEATIIATFNADPIIDTIMTASVSFYDFLSSKSQQSTVATGKVRDGSMEVVVRSLTRVVMR